MTSYIETNTTPFPDARGYYGEFGGRFVPETLMPALDELITAYQTAMADPKFQMQLAHLQATYTGRPTPITFAGRLTAHLGGAQIYLKREDLAHTGAHKINNALGQALLAQRMGKQRVVAETGAGQHGVASATAAALLGLDCHVYMGTVDIARQQPNVFRMKLLGAEVIPVESGSKTLKDAINEAIRDWVTNVRDTFYLLGSALGPHPYPMIVRDFQSVIGVEARQQMLDQVGRLPDTCIACVGGGSNAIGLFHAFRDDPDVDLVGVEAGGRGIASGEQAQCIMNLYLRHWEALVGEMPMKMSEAPMVRMRMAASVEPMTVPTPPRAGWRCRRARSCSRSSRRASSGRPPTWSCAATHAATRSRSMVCASSSVA